LIIRLLLSFAIFLTFIAMLFGITFVISLVLDTFVADEKVAKAISIGVSLLITLPLFMYSYFWLTPASEIADPGSAPGFFGKWEAAKGKSKRQTVDIRCAIVLGVIGFTTSLSAGWTGFVNLLVTFVYAWLGWLIGSDFKRRLVRIRKEYARQLESRDEDDSNSFCKSTKDFE